MNTPRVLSKGISSLLALGAIAVSPALLSTAQAASQVWDAEAGDNLWQNLTNWAGNTGFPGALSGFSSTDDATFSLTGATAPIDLGGTVNIRSLLFGVSGGDAAAFTIGDANDTLNFTTGGGVTINAGVTAAQTIGAAGTIINLSNALTATNTFTNNGTGLLTIAGNLVQNAPTGSGTTVNSSLLTVTGTGNTTITGALTNAGAALSTTVGTSLLKTGTGTLTLSNGSVWAGNAAQGTGTVTNQFPLVVRSGTLLLNGGAHSVTGEAVIGGFTTAGAAGNNARIQVDAGTLAISGYLSVGRGNGVGAVSSDLTLNNNAVVTAGNFSAGYNGNSTSNKPLGSIALNGSSSFTVASGGAFNVAESAGSNITITLSNSAQLSALGAGVKNIGNAGTGVLTLNNSSSATFGAATGTGGGFSIGFTGGNGTLNLKDSSSVTFSGLVNLGYNTGVGTVNMSGGTWSSGEIRVGAYDSATNTSAVNATGNLNVSGGAMTASGLTFARGNQALNAVNGNATFSGGVVNSTQDVYLGYNGAGLAKLTVSGGVFNIGTTAAKWMRIGELNTARGQMDVTSGSVNFYNGSSMKFSPTTGSGANVVTQSGGNVTFYSNAGTAVGGAGVVDLQTTGSAANNNTYNLNGGVLTVPQIVSTATTGARTFNFNGGTLKAAIATTAFLNLGSGTGTARANIRDGGAIIDTNGLNVTIPQPLLHSDIGTDAANDGGLTKNGTGALTLAGVNSYTGPTNLNAGALVLTAANATTGTVNVNAGTLTLANTTGSATGSSSVNVNSGATLTGSGSSAGVTLLASGGVLAPGSAGVGSLTLGALTLSAGSLLNYEITDASTRDFVTVSNADGLTINGGAFRLYQPGTTTTFSTNGVYNLIGFTGAIGGAGVSALSVDAGTLDATKSYTFGTAGGFVTLSIANAGATPNFWNTDANGNWSAGANWTLGASPNAPGAIANFGGGGATITAPRTVTLDANRTVGSIGFNSAQSYMVSGANTLTLNNDTDPVAQITDAQGNHTLAVALNAASATTQFTVLASADTLTVSGPLSGATNVVKNGSGLLVLSAANSYTGGTTVSSGTLKLSGAGTLGSAANSLSVTGGALDLGGGSLSIGATTISAGSILNGSLAPASLSANGSGPSVISASISGSTGVTKDGAGTLTLSGNNSYTGNTVVNAGVLAVNSANALGSPTNSVNFAGGALQVDGAAMANLGAARTLVGFPSAINLTDGNNTFTIPDNITSAGALVKQGPGKLVMSGVNTFGATLSPSVQNGTLEISGSLTAANTSGGIEIAPTTGSTATVTVLPGATVNTSRVIIGGNTANTVGAGSGALTQTGGVINARQWFTVGSGIGTATTAASGVFTMTGGVLNASTSGTQNMEVANFAGATGTVTVSGSAAINLYNNAALALGANNNAGSGAFNQDGGTVTFYSDGGVTPGGAGGLRLGNAATLPASSTYTYNLNGGVLATPSISRNTGAGNLSGRVFNFNGGVLKATAANTAFIPSTITTNVKAGGAKIDANGFDLTIASVLAHDAGLGTNADGGLTKSGAGRLTLSGANTYTGSTTIEGGTLVLSGSISGTASINVKSGAVFDVSALTGGFPLGSSQTLKGDGGVLGAVSASSGSKIAPGQGAGVLAFSGNLDLTLAVTPAASGALLFDLAAPAASDQVVFSSGALTIGSGLLGFDDFAFNALSGFTNGVYTLFDGSSAIVGALDAAHLSGSLGGDVVGTLSLADNGQDIVLTVVPEPGSSSLLMAGVGSLLGLRRFRRRTV